MNTTINFHAHIGGDANITSGTATLYHATGTGAQTISVTPITGRDFQLNLPDGLSGYFYVTVQVTGYRIHENNYTTAANQDVTMLAIFLPQDDSVWVSCQTTVASAYAFARMIFLAEGAYGQTINIKGSDKQLSVAYGMKNNFIMTDGSISNVISLPPNGLETNSYPLFNFLSNLFYYSLTDINVYNQWLSLAVNGSSPATTSFQALMHMARHPFTNVQSIYDLISPKHQWFYPSLPSLDVLPRNLSPVPNQWTLTIKANRTGANNFLFAGAAFVAFDKEGKAWVTNNFRAGSANSGTHIVVLKPDGSPAPISPLFGGGLLGTAFGAAVDPTGESIAIGNFGWGEELYNPQTGSISLFKYDGTVLSPPEGITPGLSRVQGLCYDKSGNLWMASVGQQNPFAPGPVGPYAFTPMDSACVVYPGGDPTRAISFTGFNGGASPYHSTFDVAINSQGDAVVTNIGNGKEGFPSSVYKLRLNGDQLTCLNSWVSDYVDPAHPNLPNQPAEPKVGYEELRQVAFDQDDNIFVVAITSSRVIKFDPDLNYLGEFKTNIYAPWGVVFDGAGKMFISNFGHETERSDPKHSLDMRGPFGVVVISDQDDSKTQIMTVPTGGKQVMLPNGLPLYGNNSNPDGAPYECYEPIMRLTASNIDAAGNLWAMNNWKPALAVDVSSNPGGDGVVIYVGVAEPLVS